MYVTFTALAMTVAFDRDAEHATAGGAALTLLLTVVGTLLAVFVADVTAHMVRHSSLPSRSELAHLVYVSFGSLTVIVVPFALLGLSALGVIGISAALRAIVNGAGYHADRRGPLRRTAVERHPWLKIFVLAIMAALGLAVLAIELSVH